MSLLKWAAVVGVLAVVAAVFGFLGIVEVVADIAKVLFFILLAGVVLVVIAGVWTYKKIT